MSDTLPSDADKTLLIADLLELAGRYAIKAAEYARASEILKAELYSRKALETIEEARSMP